MSLYQFVAFSFWTVFALVLTVVSYFLLSFIVKPLLNMSFYKKQGLPCYFYPVHGSSKRSKEYQQKFNDSMYYYRELPQKDQNIPAEAVNFGSRVTIFLYDPKLIKDFYAKHAYYKKVKLSKGMTTLLGTGILLAEGDLWKRHRKAISSMFHFEFLKQNIPLVVNTTREFLNEVATTSMENVSVMDEIQKITGEIVGRIFFGEKLNQYTFRGQPLTLYLARLLARTAMIHANNPITLILLFTNLDQELVPSYKAHMDEVREFRQFCFKIIQDRRASKSEEHDLLGLLLKTQNATNEIDRFTDEDIINEFVTFFVGGMDTTGHLITMVLYLMYKHPEYIEKLQKEIKELYDQTPMPTIEALNQMEMMHAVLKEAMRIYTPVPTIPSRSAEADHELGDLKIKKGTSVRPAPLYNYSNAKYFENPEKFYPERWLGKKEQSLDSFVFIPFSAGARNCIGQHLGIIEAKVITAEFLKRFTMKLVPEDFQLIMGFNFMYEPKKKILMDLKHK